VRTTIRLDERLLLDAKKLAAESGRTLTAIIEESLRERLARRREPAPHRRIRLPTFKGTGVLPGVDLDDSAALADLMDEPDAPA
jgi:hypothetical protein